VQLGTSIEALIRLVASVRQLAVGQALRATQFKFLWSFISGLRDYLWTNSTYKFEYALTNPHYRRKENMKWLLEKSGPQEQVLSLQNYFLSEYELAVNKLGHIQTDSQPGQYPAPKLRPLLQAYY